MNAQEVMEMSQKYVMNTYGREPIVFERGEGSTVWDLQGKKYLDFLTGISVLNLGHRPKSVLRAVEEQMQKLFHCSNLYYSIPGTLLARELVERTFADRVFFCNSGAEANEASVKLARRYATKTKGENCFEVICMKQSFHGRTLGMLSATGQEKVRKGFAPYLPGFLFVDFGDFEALKAAVCERTAAVFLEPIQGEGGVNIPTKGYLKNVRNLCDEKEVLLLLDEVQTAMGRTGKFCAYEWESIEPDIMSMSKSLGGGLPLGACLATEEVAQVFEPGSHASTFGANPIACAAGIAMVQGVGDPKVLENCRVRGEQFQTGLKRLAQEFSMIKEVRGRGLMVGVEIQGDANEIKKACLRHGLLLNLAGPQTLRFLPALNVTEMEVEEALLKVRQSLREINGGG